MQTQFSLLLLYKLRVSSKAKPVLLIRKVVRSKEEHLPFTVYPYDGS